MKRTLIMALALLALAGCRVKETKDAEGDTKYQLEPATVEVGTDTQTVKVPSVQLEPDTTVPDTTTTR